MDIIRRAYRRVPLTVGSTPLPTADEKKHGRLPQFHQRVAFLRKPIRLRGNSSISVPLGVVILFPCIVLVLILVLFVRHPSSPGSILAPAGAPPAIRYGFVLSSCPLTDHTC
jgi:mannosyltransferase